uniref:C6 domain-containing protein n=1 Tax=Panagrolaimus sp. ES5 TaxID=591445 RepID=A0AC34F6M8_9BILA
MRGGGGGDIPVTTLPPVLACSTCSNIAVKTGSGNGVDEPITQTSSIGANGCRTVTATCTAATPGIEVNYFFSNDGADLGTASATTTITRNFVCNANRELVLTENGVSAVVDEVECISAGTPPVCTTCANIAVVTGTGSGDDEPIIQTPGTDANGCKTLTISCTTPKVGETITYLFTNDGNDLGTLTDTTTISRTLTCDENGDYLLTEGTDTLAVDSVECITATAPVCTTCANIAVVTGTGSGDDEPIIQTPGTDANNCKTLTISCTTTKVGETITYLFTNDGADLGSLTDTTTISRTLTCDENGDYLLTEGTTTLAVDSVECITA